MADENGEKYQRLVSDLIEATAAKAISERERVDAERDRADELRRQTEAIERRNELLSMLSSKVDDLVVLNRSVIKDNPTAPALEALCLKVDAVLEILRVLVSVQVRKEDEIDAEIGRIARLLKSVGIGGGTDILVGGANFRASRDIDVDGDIAGRDKR